MRGRVRESERTPGCAHAAPPRLPSSAFPHHPPISLTLVPPTHTHPTPHPPCPTHHTTPHLPHPRPHTLADTEKYLNNLADKIANVRMAAEVSKEEQRAIQEARAQVRSSAL